MKAYFCCRNTFFKTTTLNRLIYHFFNLQLSSFNGYFQWILFTSIKEIDRLRKEINRFLSKGMSYIYLKVTIEKK